MIDLAVLLFRHAGVLPEQREDTKRQADTLAKLCDFHRIADDQGLIRLVAAYAQASRRMKDIEARIPWLHPDDPKGAA